MAKTGKGEKLAVDHIFFYSEVEKFIRDLIPNTKDESLHFKRIQKGESALDHMTAEHNRFK
jgi:hypothetical protein